MTSKTVFVVKADGSEPFTTEVEDLIDMQAIVGGLVTAINIDLALSGVRGDMWAHEEALLWGEPEPNMVASVCTSQPIFGDVFFSGPPTDDGEMTSVTNEMFRFVKFAWNSLHGAKR